MIDSTSTPVDLQAEFMKMFVDWKRLKIRGNLQDLLHKAESTYPNAEIFGVYGELNWKDVQFAYWYKAVEYIEEIVHASDDKIQW